MNSLKIFMAIMLTAMLFMAGAASAQRTTFVNRNGDEKFGYNMTTTDSAFHYLDSVTLKTNEGGMIIVSVVGYAKDTAYTIYGVKKVGFNKRRGTLTMATPVDDMATVTPAALGSSTWDLVAVNDKIYVRIKGKLNNSITWTSIIKRKSVSYP